MTAGNRAGSRARWTLVIVAGLMWGVFVLVTAFTRLLGQGGSALFAAFVWHGFIGFALARAFPPRDAPAESAPFTVTRNALLATAASLASAFLVAYALTGGA